MIRLATLHCGVSIGLGGRQDVHSVDVTTVWSCAVSCLGEFVATASDDGTVRVWDLPAAIAKGEAEVKRIVEIRDGGGTPTAPKSSSHFAVPQDTDLDGRDDALDITEPTFELSPKLGACRAVDFHPLVEDILAAAFDFPAVIVWDLDLPNKVNKSKQGTPKSSSRNSASPRAHPKVPGQMLSSDHLEGASPRSRTLPHAKQRKRRASAHLKPMTIVERETETSRRLAIFSEHTHPIKSLCFVQGVGESCQIISASGNGDTLLWSVNEPYHSSLQQTTVHHRLPLVGEGESVSENRCVACRDDGKMFATVCSSHDEGDTVILWDTVTGKMLILMSGHKEAPYAVHFLAKGQGLVSVDKAGVLLIHRSDVDNFVHNAPSASNSMLLLLTGPPLQARLLLDRQSDVMMDTAISPYRFERAMEATMGDVDDPTVDEALEFRRALLSDGALGKKEDAPCAWLGCLVPELARRILCCCFRARRRGADLPNGGGSSRSSYVAIGGSRDGADINITPALHGNQNRGKRLGDLIRTAARNNEPAGSGFRSLLAISDAALMDWRLKFKALHRGVCLDESTFITHYPFAWASPLHVLADAALNNAEDAGAAQRKLRQEDLVEEWKELDVARYAPVLNSAGQTPFEVAVRTGNTLFVQTVLREKGILDDGDSDTYKGPPSMLTVGDLNALLDCDPELASEYLEQEWLLQSADAWAPQAQDDCWSFNFEDGMTMMDKMKVGMTLCIYFFISLDHMTEYFTICHAKN